MTYDQMPTFHDLEWPIYISLSMNYLLCPLILLSLLLYKTQLWKFVICFKRLSLMYILNSLVDLFVQKSFWALSNLNVFTAFPQPKSRVKDPVSKTSFHLVGSISLTGVLLVSLLIRLVSQSLPYLLSLNFCSNVTKLRRRNFMLYWMEHQNDKLGKFKENHITCNDTESQTLKWMQQRDIIIIYTKRY